MTKPGSNSADISSTSPTQPPPNASTSLLNRSEDRQGNPSIPKPPSNSWSFKAIQIILGSNFLLVILLFSLGSFTPLRINECLLENHPVKVLLLFSLVLGVVWATGMLMPSDNFARLLRYGAVITVMIWVATIFLVINNYQNEKFLRVKGHDNVAMVVVFLIIVTLLLRAFMHRRGVHDGAEMNAHAMKKWGELIALAIMMLAMFFLALEFKETNPQHKDGDAIYNDASALNSNTSGFKVKWEEIPAILMVFLLAELGVALVVTASMIRNGVKDAAELATKAVSRAEGVESSLTEAREILDGVEKAASARIKELKEVAGGLTEIKIVSDSAPALCRLAALEPAELWRGLNQFTKDWTPKSSQGNVERKHPLVGVLFNKFIGENTSGTVRSDEFAVSCVTVDSVFADASTAWLNAMAHVGSEEGKKLIVWAVTSLLPTDFALPTVWWGAMGDGESYGPPKRTKTLETFIGSVINECRTGQAVGEYRRITVFPHVDRFIPNSKEPIDVPNSDGLRDWQSKFIYSLDNWLLWDPRVQKNQDNPQLFLDKVQYWSTMLANSAWKHLKQKDGSLQEPDTSIRKINWKLLEELHAASLGSEMAINPEHTVQELKEMRTLPDWFGPHARSLYFFHNDFCIDNEHPLTGGVIAANDEFLNHPIEIKDLRELGLDPELVNLIEQEKQENILTLKEIYKLFGWHSLREWYCNFLHRGDSKIDEGAWWAVSNYFDLEQDPVLIPFKMPWDETEVVTLDLLLIGTSPESNKDAEPTWHGAAFSNITFDRTECTIRLVTNQDELKRIAGTVKKLCCNFTKDTPKDVSSYGTWRDWPIASGIAQAKSRPATAE